ncbi:MAG: hypothetical protein COC24_010765 [Alphaproteobacteria bacterium]|nr:hypothetical protein [Alphaproteobacteria bacterium]
MKLSFDKLSKTVLVLAASMALTSCGSVGGFSDLLGISNEGIDAQNIEVNNPLLNANNGNLPIPEGASLNTVPLVNGVATTPTIVAPIIVAPKIIAPTIVPPKVVVAKVTAPKITAPKVTQTPITPKVAVKPIVAAKPIVAVAKVLPSAYKFVDLFTFRSDMRAGKMLNPLATARQIAETNPDCKLVEKEFTCGEYYIPIE